MIFKTKNIYIQTLQLGQIKILAPLTRMLKLLIWLIFLSTELILSVQQRWKNLGEQQIITPRRNVLADIFDHLADNFDHPADKNVRETFLRGVMICCTPRFFQTELILSVQIAIYSDDWYFDIS